MKLTTFAGICLVVGWMAFTGLAAETHPDVKKTDRAMLPVVLGEHVYQVVQGQRERNGVTQFEAAVEVQNQRTKRPVYQVTAYLNSPGPLPDSDGPPGIIDPIQHLEPFANGLLMTTVANETLFLDPADRSIVAVRNDLGNGHECEVHHEPLLGILVRIRYGKPNLHVAAVQVDRSAYPHPVVQAGGGCCVMQRKAAIRYCPKCDELSRKAAALLPPESK